MTFPEIRTERLTLRPFTPEAIEAMMAGDALRLAAITTAAFPQPLAPPPLMEDVFPMIRRKLLEDPAQLGWWAWVVIRRDTGQAVGSVGFGGPPDGEGAVVMGYATYPGAEGSGFASEAAAGPAAVGHGPRAGQARRRDDPAVEREEHPGRREDRHAAGRRDLGRGSGGRAALRGGQEALALRRSERSEGPGGIRYVPDAPRSFTSFRTTKGSASADPLHRRARVNLPPHRRAPRQPSHSIERLRVSPPAPSSAGSAPPARTSPRSPRSRTSPRRRRSCPA